MRPNTSHHEIEIKIRGNIVEPVARIPDLKVGDTVHYSFKGEGTLMIVFPAASPYRTDKMLDTHVTSAEKLTVMQAGQFQSGCRVKRPNGTIIGWDPKDKVGTKESGGDHNVKPN